MMRRGIAVCGVVIFALAMLASPPTEAGDSDWTKIGSTQCKAKNNEESMRIGAGEGFFRWIKFSAEGGKIDLKRVTVSFTGGDEEVFDNFTPIRDGGETRTITVASAVKKTIRRIDFEYVVKDDADEVKVTAWGRRDND